MTDRAGDRPGGWAAGMTGSLALNGEAAARSDATEETAPSRRTGSRAQWKAQTRERVLAAAGQVFAERGYADAPVSEIASVAGVAVGSVYVHFANKRELFWAVLERHLEAERRDGEVATDADVSAFVAGYDTRLRERSEDPKAVALMAEMWLHSVRDESFRADMAHHLREGSARLSVLVHRLRQHIPPIGGSPAGTPGPAVDSSRPHSNPDWVLSDEHIAVIAAALFRSLVQARCIDPASVPDDLFSTTMLYLARLARN